jgi:hypothetical protein
MGQTTRVRAKLIGIFVLVALAVSSCSNAPDPGNLAAFCRLLESGSGLTATPTATDLDLLVTVAPPAIRETIEALQDRARDFDELMAEDPPDLEALFNARFDPVAENELDALDVYAENSCGIVVDRPPSTRWNTFVRENHPNDPWVELTTTQFDVVSDRIDTATVVFIDEPEPIELLEKSCLAMAAFLAADEADPGRVRVLIGSVVALEYPTPDAVCRLP